MSGTRATTRVLIALCFLVAALTGCDNVEQKPHGLRGKVVGGYELYEKEGGIYRTFYRLKIKPAEGKYHVVAVTRHVYKSCHRGDAYPACA